MLFFLFIYLPTQPSEFFPTMEMFQVCHNNIQTQIETKKIPRNLQKYQNILLASQS